MVLPNCVCFLGFGVLVFDLFVCLMFVGLRWVWLINELFFVVFCGFVWFEFGL